MKKLLLALSFLASINIVNAMPGPFEVNVSNFEVPLEQPTDYIGPMLFWNNILFVAMEHTNASGMSTSSYINYYYQGNWYTINDIPSSINEIRFLALSPLNDGIIIGGTTNSPSYNIITYHLHIKI